MNRPTSVTVFGVLNIVFGAMGLLSTLVGLLVMSTMSPNPMIQILTGSAVYRVWMWTVTPIGIAASAAILAAGIGFLLLKAWARKIAIVYSIYRIISAVVNVMFMTLVVFPALSEQFSGKAGPERVGAAVGAEFGGVFGVVSGMIYPVLLLVFMFRKNVITAFTIGPSADSRDVPPPIQAVPSSQV